MARELLLLHHTEGMVSKRKHVNSKHKSWLHSKITHTGAFITLNAGSLPCIKHPVVGLSKTLLISAVWMKKPNKLFSH